MSFADRVGVVALILAFAGLGITILWPTQRWIGWISLVLAGILGLFWGLREFRTKKNSVNESPVAEELEPTLISLMDTSLPQMNKMWGKPVLQFADGSSVELTSALYFDMFTSGSKFLGFHIPCSSRVLEACSILAVHAIELGDALSNGGLSIALRAPGGNPQTLNDLKYSGKVYLYHEDSLTHKQMADVEDIFKAQQLNVELRGPDFLTPAWIAWKKKSLKQPE